MNSRKRSLKLLSAALTSLFILQQSMMLSAIATNITGVANTSAGTGSTYNIRPTAVITNTDIGYRKYENFNLSQGDVANLLFKYGRNDINTFVNLVDNQVNINGIVNSMRDGAFYNGRAIFVSPNGVVVGASGVLNVGSFGAYTPKADIYNSYKNNPTSDLAALSNPANASSSVTVNGKVLAAQNIDIVSGKINVPGQMVAGKGVVNAFDGNLFNTLVNTQNMKSASGIVANNGKITFTSTVGTDVSGVVKNYGSGVVSMTNTGAEGISVSGTAAGVGDVIMTNTGNGGIKIASTGNVRSFKNVYMNDKSPSGIMENGIIKADEDVKIAADGGDVVIGDRTENNNYINAGKNIDINVNNGSILNYESQQANAKHMNITQAKTLLNADGNLNMDVNNGTIGLKVGDNCTGGYCTGISDAQGTRDYARSINGNIKGTVTAKTTDSINPAAKQNDFVINYAAINSDMNVDSVKADGRVILTTDYNQNDGSTRYDMLNASTNSAKANVEGYGLSLIASGNIGAEDKPLTFNQTNPGTLATKENPIPSAGYGMDVLANEDIYIKGLDDKYTTNNVCSMISREGNIDAEFAGNTYIDEVTSEKDLKLVTRGKSMEVNHLGTVPRTPVDYFGPRANGLADNPTLPGGGYTGVGEKDAIPNNATVKALDINKNIRPNGNYNTPEYPGYYAYADSTVKINDGRLDNGKLDVTADNIIANGVKVNFGKDGFTKTPDPSTSKIEGTNGIPTGHAVKPDDVTDTGRDEHDRNYYKNPGDGA